MRRHLFWLWLGLEFAVQAAPIDFHCVNFDRRLTVKSDDQGYDEITIGSENMGEPLLPSLDPRVRTAKFSMGPNSCGQGGGNAIACYSDVCMLQSYYDWSGQKIELPAQFGEIAFIALRRRYRDPKTGADGERYEYRLEMRSGYNIPDQIIQGAYELYPGNYCHFSVEK